MPYAVLIKGVVGLLSGDRDAVESLVSEMPQGRQEEFNFDEAVAQISRRDARQLEDTQAQMGVFLRLCEDPNAETVEAMIRFELETSAKTCKLFLNSWTDTFKKVSEKVWSLADSSAKGQCAVSRLDRFECKGPYSCAYISEQRVLNKEGEGVIPCRELEETAFRYTHGEPIYLNCSIMSWF